MLVVAVSAVLCVVVVVLVTMHCLVYAMKADQQRQLLPKGLPKEWDISVREVERCLEADVFLDGCPWWPPLRSHQPFIMFKMFAFAEATGQKEIGPFTRAGDCLPPNETWWQSLPPWDSLAPAHPGNEIRKINNKVLSAEEGAQCQSM